VTGDAWVYAEVQGSAGQELLSAIAMPPVAGLVDGSVFGSPLGYLDEAFGLPPGTVRTAGLHLDRAALSTCVRGPLFVLVFDDPQAAAHLLAAVGAAGPEGYRALPNGMALMQSDRLLLAGTPALCRAALAGGAATLDADTTFAAARRAAQGKAAWAYVAPGPILRFIAEHPAGERDLGAARALGLDHLDYVLLTAGGSAAAGALELTAAFDSPDAPLLDLMPREPMAVADAVPADAAAVAVLNFGDARRFLGGVRDLALDVDRAMTGGRLEIRMLVMESRLGMAFDDVAVALGPGLAVYMPQAAPGEFMHPGQWTAVLLVKDRGQFAGILDTLLPPMPGVPAAPKAVGGLQVSPGPGGSFYYAMTDVRLVVGGSVEAIARYAEWLASPGRAALADHADSRAVLLLRADGGRLLKGYPAPGPGAKLVVELTREGRELKLTTGVTDFDPSVAYSRAVTGYAAVAAAMLMPALARAREEARRSKSRVNLHMIGLGIARHSAAHDYTYPPDLRTLLAEGYVEDAATFLDPSDGHPPPGDPPSSYVYVGPITRFAPSNVIICYSRRGISREGRNVLHVDNSVRWVREADLHDPDGDPRTSLVASYAALVRAYREHLTPEEDARLRRFYEIGD
jgi:hypothetical protein